MLLAVGAMTASVFIVATAVICVVAAGYVVYKVVTN